MARILVVDDDDAIRQLLCKVLGRGGHAAVEAADGKAAMARLEEISVDLVITDIYMPEMEGVETILKLQRDFPEVRIVAISGGWRLEKYDCLRVARRLGATRTLAKPFTPAELLDAVREAL